MYIEIAVTKGKINWEGSDSHAILEECIENHCFTESKFCLLNVGISYLIFWKSVVLAIVFYCLA